MSETTYIEAIDKTCEPVSETCFRKVSLGMNESHLETLLLLGNLPHCTEITFDKANAIKLIEWLSDLHGINSIQGIYIDAKDKHGCKIHLGDTVKFTRPSGPSHTETFEVKIKNGAIFPFGTNMACGPHYGETWNFYAHNCEIMEAV